MSGEVRFGRLTDPPATLLIARARVIDPSDGTDAVRDLGLLDGRLVDPGALPSDARRLDAAGLIAAPAWCDLHMHLREPGAEAAETVESGSRAAARGGYGAVCAMPNTEPPIDEPARAFWIVERARAASCVVHVVGAVTHGRAGERLADLAALAEAGVVAFSDDGASVPSARLARVALAYLAELGLPLVEHAEEPTLAASALMRAGPTATRLGLAGWPSSAELLIVERDIALSAETGGRLHLTHLSTAGAIEAVRRAKAQGLAVTCDVTPHHFALTDAWVAGDRRWAWEEPVADAFDEPLDARLAYDARCRVNPPLASRADALALLAGLADGTVDAIATDHAPHPPEHKEVPFAEAAPGMIGLETTLSVGLAAVQAGALELPLLLRALSSGPAAVIGEQRSLGIGQQAELVVFDPSASWWVEADGLESRSANTPLVGRELPGVVRLTLARGRITYDATDVA